MAIARAALLAAAAAVLSLVLVSGGSEADPRTPAALPGLPPPFLGTAVSGDGGLTAAVDAYGDVVDLRAPGPAGRALIENPSARQAAGTVAADTGVVPRLRVGGGPALPLWRADAVRQRYEPGTNVVRTVAFVDGARLVVRTAAAGEWLAMELIPRASRERRARAAISVDVGDEVHCARGERAGALDLLCRVGRALPPVLHRDARELFRGCDRVFGEAVEGGRRWLGRARGLGAGAPGWARAMYRRSLLVLRALTDRRTGAVAAGARDGWAYVWPRDAATAALAYAAAGYRGEARRVAGFLSRLGTGIARAARFDGAGAPVPGRGPQGDAPGWVAVAKRAAYPDTQIVITATGWLELPDYREGSAGTYLANAIAALGGLPAPAAPAARGPGAAPGALGADGTKSGRYFTKSAHRRAIVAEFGTARGLVREAGDPSSGLDSAAAWAVRPFSSPALYPAARRTLLHLAAEATPYGITPGEGWRGGVDPWTAPTAWSAWSLGALGERRAALRLLADLRRAATGAGALPERVDARTGVPRSTTPLLWSHAFAVLALRQLWPKRAA
ncbi:MAG: glycoside hydrolase family 15 protein [Solirubrobacterales bacterium]